MGFGVWGLRFGVWGEGRSYGLFPTLRVQASRVRNQGSALKDTVSGLSVWGLRFWVWGLGFGV